MAYDILLSVFSRHLYNINISMVLLYVDYILPLFGVNRYSITLIQ